MIVFTNISDGKDINIQDMKLKDNHAKYDKLSKEHELLKEKLDSVMKELSDEKEKKKSNVKIEEKSTDLQNSEHFIFFFFFNKLLRDRQVIIDLFRYEMLQ